VNFLCRRSGAGGNIPVQFLGSSNGPLLIIGLVLSAIIFNSGTAPLQGMAGN
jgi:hypothetical protein